MNEHLVEQYKTAWVAFYNTLLDNKRKGSACSDIASRIAILSIDTIPRARKALDDAEAELEALLQTRNEKELYKQIQ